MLRKILLIIILCFSFFIKNQLYAVSLPVTKVFSDIKNDYKYINELQVLYDKWMIVPDSEWKFNPYKLLTRDDFVWIAMEVSCKKCIQPNVDIYFTSKYINPPFFDVNKINKNFYCISEAKEKNFVKGYDKNYICDDKTYKSWETPFCVSNNIVLEEALAIILRMSWILTNEQAENIRQDIIAWKITEDLASDVKPKNIDWTVYSFYPDFKKALEYEVVEYDTSWNKKTYNLVEKIDNKLRPKKNITKEEFLKIAYVALKANSCQEKTEDSLALKMKIFDKICNENKKDCDLSNLDETENIYDFTWEVWWICEKWIKEPEWYIWRFYNKNTWIEIKKYWKYIDNYKFLSSWDWRVFLRVIDNCWNTAEVYNDITIKGILKETKLNDLKISIDANPIIWTVALKVNLEWIANWWSWGYSYEWNFWDWEKWFWKTIDYIYKKTWIYKVKLKVTDKDWNIWEADVIIKVLEEKEKKDSDLDWIYDFEDICPLVKWLRENDWCPIYDIKCDGNDKNQCKSWYECIKNNSWKYVCLPNIVPNSCDYSWWNLISWKVICNSCPCTNTLDFISAIRKCDKLFPAITSPNEKSVYSQWKIYEVK